MVISGILKIKIGFTKLAKYIFDVCYNKLWLRLKNNIYWLLIRNTEYSYAFATNIFILKQHRKKDFNQFFA